MRCRPLAKHTSGKGGTRQDLGIYVRSSWEANYARYLNFLVDRGQIESWRYEPKTFEFPVKRGSRFYTPDFEVTERGGRIVYHEVKGYMDQRSATKLRRMETHFPEVVVVVIGGDEMREIKTKVGRLIPGWEWHSNDKLGRK